MADTGYRPSNFRTRILVSAAADFAINLLLPTVLYFLLAPTHLSATVRLTIGGYFVAAKAGAGHLSSTDANAHDAGFFRTFRFCVVTAVIVTMVTLAVRAWGFSDSLAIASGTILLALVQGARFMRGHRELDGFALLVLLELAATIIFTSVSNTPRFILIRPSFYSAIAGFYVLSTLPAKRPLMMQVTKPMATEGDPVRAEAFERAGRESILFRRAEQGMTAGLGIVLLAEAILRIVTVWSHPQSDVIVASLWSQMLGIILFVIWFAVIKIFLVPVASREVDSFMSRSENFGSQSL